MANLLGQDRQALARFADQVGSLRTMTMTPTPVLVRLAFEHTFGH